MFPKNFTLAFERIGISNVCESTKFADWDSFSKVELKCNATRCLIHELKRQYNEQISPLANIQVNVKHSLLTVHSPARMDKSSIFFLVFLSRVWLWLNNLETCCFYTMENSMFKKHSIGSFGREFEYCGIATLCKPMHVCDSFRYQPTRLRWQSYWNMRKKCVSNKNEANTEVKKKMRWPPTVGSRFRNLHTYSMSHRKFLRTRNKDGVRRIVVYRKWHWRKRAYGAKYLRDNSHLGTSHAGCSMLFGIATM